MINAFSLTWPAGWRRTPKHQIRSARFGTSFARARDSLLNQLRLLGARGVVISSNLSLRRDGLPYANTPQPEDRGVAVYFEREGKQQCIPCDKWARIEDNIHAINLTVEALRGLERWGAKDMVDAAFTGFQALPSPEMVMAMPQRRSWHEILGVNPDAPEEVKKAAYRALARKHHPDAGGSRQEWDELQRAAQDAGINENRARE